ncbi:ATP/GTP-binding protein [Kitasatospora sp. NPDC088783]|uniref:AAA family ATPase n=1 Tax=Kitasatospora sp. NPDC088783 TaxID=3364077 RepID=UPI00382B0570
MTHPTTLLRFSASGHRSIDGMVEIDLDPAGDAPACALALLGANGSGKTSVLSAPAFMRDAVLHSCDAWAARDPQLDPRPLPVEPFALRRVPEPSSFEADVLLGDTVWTYGFELSGDRVLSEWLRSEDGEGAERLWIDRDADRGPLTRDAFDPGLAHADLLATVTRADALVLSAAGLINHAQLAPLFAWFRDNLHTLTPTGAADQDRTLQALRENSAARRALSHLLHATDQNIAGITLNTDTGELVFAHGSPGRPGGGLTWAQQSGGTRTTVTLLHAALRALRTGTVLLVDDFGSSLHPHLAAEMVRLFTDTELSNTRGAQVVLATHTATVLGDGVQHLLAPHEIVLVEKHDDGATRAAALSDFHIGEREDLRRSYLQGAFGGVPHLLEGRLPRELHATAL